MSNYFEDIVSEKDPAIRKKNLDALIAERTPSEILVLTIISIVSDDEVIRRTALERIDKRNQQEGNTAARVASLIDSWRREGAIMTWPEPMNAEERMRAAEIEGALLAGRRLAGVTATTTGSIGHDSSADTSPPFAARESQRPWWKFW